MAVYTDVSFEELEALLRTDWCQPLADAGVTYRCQLAEGDSVDALLEAIAASAARLCVVGRRGHRPHPDLVLGSTSLQLIAESPVPVLVVPPQTGAAPGTFGPARKVAPARIVQQDTERGGSRGS